jgi:plasmid replication initiation protein
MHSLTITKSNKLIEARYKLALEQQRLLLLCISQIDSQGAISDIPDTFKITASEYGQAFGLSTKNAYRQLEMAANGLYARDIELDNSKEKSRTHIRWVWKIKYHDGEGAASLSFSPDLKPYLAQLSSEFTSYQFSNICNLKSAYSIRLYELLMQFKTTKERILTLEKFRILLEIQDNQYPRFADIRRWVLQPAINELNTKTNLVIEWKPIKNGRKVNALLFNFKEDKQAKLPLE